MTGDICFKGKFGLERETLRVDKNGKLAQTEIIKEIEWQKEKLEIGKRYADRLYQKHKEDFQKSMLQQMKKVI